MNDFCLETYLIPRLFQIGRGKYFCKIYNKDHITIHTEPNRYFVCNITTGHINEGDPGCYLVEWALLFKNSGLRLRKSYACYQNVIHDIKTAIHYANSIKKENNMNEFTLKTSLFRKLKENSINYRFIDGIYNPEKIVITTKMNHDVCTVRSIPYSEDSTNAYEVRWTPVPTHILIALKIMSVKQYDTSDQLIKDILRVERELRELEKVLKPISMNDLPVIKAVDVIFNDPATIIIWADGTKTVVKAENEKFDPEKGLAMAISKKVLGNKHDYYEVFKKYVGRYEKKQKKANKEN